jgi:hypothetical protein
MGLHAGMDSIQVDTTHGDVNAVVRDALRIAGP